MTLLTLHFFLVGPDETGAAQEKSSRTILVFVDVISHAACIAQSCGRGGICARGVVSRTLLRLSGPRGRKWYA